MVMMVVCKVAAIPDRSVCACRLTLARSVYLGDLSSEQQIAMNVAIAQDVDDIRKFVQSFQDMNEMAR